MTVGRSAPPVKARQARTVARDPKLVRVRLNLKVATCVAFAFAAGAAAQQKKPMGYLGPGTFDLRDVLPPAPRPGDPRADADRAIFRATRKFAGTPRYAMATRDVHLTPADLARDFSCAVGIVLTTAHAPRTIAMIDRAAIDTARQTDAVKQLYRRDRPFRFDPGPVCETLDPATYNYDYPSGHTTLGWTWATILARLAPDRATAILARGRAYGESRAICGMHNWSAIEGGFLSAAATMDVVSATLAFQADMANARREVDRLRADPAIRKPDPKSCAVEAALAAQGVNSAGIAVGSFPH